MQEASTMTYTTKELCTYLERILNTEVRAMAPQHQSEVLFELSGRARDQGEYKRAHELARQGFYRIGDELTQSEDEIPKRILIALPEHRDAEAVRSLKAFLESHDYISLKQYNPNDEGIVGIYGSDGQIIKRSAPYTFLEKESTSGGTGLIATLKRLQHTDTLYLEFARFPIPRG